MTAAQKLGAAAVTAAIVLGTAALSQLPTSRATPSEAIMRFSWRTQGLAIEDCRTLTPEEMEAIPSHMRRPQECTRVIVDYELSVDVGSRPAVRDTIGPAGARRDRPVYVFRDVPVRPGTHVVSVRFSALVPDDFEVDGRPVSYSWEGSLALVAGEIALITLDDAGDRLVRVDPRR